MYLQRVSMIGRGSRESLQQTSMIKTREQSESWQDICGISSHNLYDWSRSGSWKRYLLSCDVHRILAGLIKWCTPWYSHSWSGFGVAVAHPRNSILLSCQHMTRPGTFLLLSYMWFSLTESSIKSGKLFEITDWRGEYVLKRSEILIFAESCN